MQVKSALILCPEGNDKRGTKRNLLGLSVGERLLLSLQYGGIEQVAFAGNGQRPASDRAEIRQVSPETLSGPILVVGSDTVLDRGLLQKGGTSFSGLPLATCAPEDVSRIMADPEGFLRSLPESDAVTGTGFAVRVRDRKSRQAARRCLLLSLRKPLDGFVSRHLNRYVSTFITGLLVPTGIRPNQLTFFIMLIGILSGVFAAMSEHWWALILSGICFQGQSILDGCDGEIARLTYRFSKTGQWMDTLGDDLTNYAFYAGLAVGMGRSFCHWWIYLLGAVTFVFQWATSFTMYQRIYKMGTGDLLAIPDVFTKDEKNSAGLYGRIVKTLRIVLKKDSFALIISVITAVGLPHVAFIAMTVGTYPAFYGIFSNELALRRMERDGLDIPKAA